MKITEHATAISHNETNGLSVDKKVNGKKQPIREDETRSIPKVMQEALCIIITSILISVDFFYLCKHFRYSNLLYVACTVICSWVVADFLSGLFHWLGDRYGTINTPIVGKLYIFGLRIHHVTPKAFTLRDTLVTNGDSFMLAIIPLALAVHQFRTCPLHEIDQIYLYEVFRFVLSLGACVQNQSHKWAHMHGALPKPVQFLQNLHFILPKQHHHFHHISPHHTRFCIISGITNYPLDKIDFWTKLETFVEFVTGFSVADDDLSWAYE